MVNWPEAACFNFIEGAMYRDVVDVIEKGGERLDLIMIPKVGTPHDVYAVDMLVTQAENYMKRKKKIGFEMIIETALGLSLIHI